MMNLNWMGNAQAFTEEYEEMMKVMEELNEEESFLAEVASEMEAPSDKEMERMATLMDENLPF